MLRHVTVACLKADNLFGTCVIIAVSNKSRHRRAKRIIVKCVRGLHQWRVGAYSGEITHVSIASTAAVIMADGIAHAAAAYSANKGI